MKDSQVQLLKQCPLKATCQINNKYRKQPLIRPPPSPPLLIGPSTCKPPSSLYC